MTEDRELFIFLEDVSSLLSQLGGFVEKAEGIVRRPQMLRMYARDLRMVAQAGEDRQRLHDEQFFRQLQESLQYIAQRNPRLAKILERHGQADAATLRQFAETLKEDGRTYHNIDTLLAMTDKIHDKKLRKAIEDHLTAIKRRIDELSMLQKGQEDMSRWNPLRQSPTALSGLVQAYLSGGKLSDGTQIQGILHFHDGELRKEMHEDQAIRMLMGSGKQAQMLQKQDSLLEGWINQIQSDMKDGQWVQDKETAKFVKALKKHAEEMEEAGNKKLGEYLLKNQRIGEQPDQWLNLLRQARQSIWQGKQALRQNHNTTTVNAQRSLSALFGRREQELWRMIQSERQKAFQTVEKDLGSLPESLLSEVQKTLEEIWQRRLKNFLRMHKSNKNHAQRMMAHSQELVDKILPEKAVQGIQRSARSAIQMASYRQKLLASTRLSSKSLPRLMQLAYTTAQSDKAFSQIQRSGQELRQRAGQTNAKEVRQLKVEAVNVINEYVRLARRIHDRLYAEKQVRLLDRTLWEFRQKHSVPIIPVVGRRGVSQEQQAADVNRPQAPEGSTYQGRNAA